ncbi:MAG TPA: hypothetical protein VD791_02275 [Burkholderiales bacterium]|nr:hypothetical protein [Burkholderiales bacterium]
MPVEITLVSVARALVEVAGWFLLGQGVLYVLAGARRDQNPVYRLFRLITSPVVRATRALTPRVIVDRHVPVVAFFLLFWIWIALQVLKRHLCALHGLAC